MDWDRFEALRKDIRDKAEFELRKAQGLMGILMPLNVRLRIAFGDGVAATGAIGADGKFSETSIQYIESDRTLRFAIQFCFRAENNQVLLPVVVPMTARYNSDEEILVRCDDTGDGILIPLSPSAADIDRIFPLLDIPLTKAASVYLSK